MSEGPKLFDAGDYNLFRYCHNDPIDLTDPMGLADEATGLLQSGTHDRLWDMTKWFDSSNTIQGNFAWQGVPYALPEETVRRMSRNEAIQKYGRYINGVWKNEDRYIIDYRVPESITSDPSYSMRWDKTIPKIGGSLVTHFSTNKDIAPGITAALKNLQRVGKLDALQEFNGSFFFRMTRGSSSISVHAYGLAVDVNGSMNPQGHPSHQPSQVRAAFTGTGFEDGGTWPLPRTDGMHFSVGF
jgi:D-alanyl-D-alanine carboxypeptidase